MSPLVALLILALSAAVCLAAAPAGKLLFDPAAPGAAEQLTSNDTLGDTTFALHEGGIDVKIKAGGKASYPGVKITPPAPWDANGYGHVEASVTNTGPKPIRVNLRLDNPGPWQEQRQNTSLIGIQPGETKLVSTIFGYSYGKSGYALKPQQIVSALIFVGKSNVVQSFRITAIRAAGPVGEKPHVDPSTLAVKPAGGVIFGADAPFDPHKQLVAQHGATLTAADSKAFTVTFSSAKASVLIRPAAGMWNLNEALQVRIRVRNTGSKPLTPALQLLSKGGPSALVPAAGPIAPGAEGELVASFIAPKPWQGVDLPAMRDGQALQKGFTDHVPGTGTPYTSNTTTGILLLAGPQDAAGSLQVMEIRADMPPRQPLPAWLGQRPPVEGDWTLTFEDNFDGNAIDLTRWNIYTQGEWHLGKATGYSKDNVIVKNGQLALRVDKRRVHHNDNPAYAMHDYAAGWADSYGKWTQRYGYFEARLKLPTAPDQFTAFWLMPDRGIDFDPQAHPKVNGYPILRNDTKDHGMEFDIMEQLSIWGPNRHDFGMHWDGYGKYHKSTGALTCYYQPDQDGFLTVGLLWTPGSITVYQNGREAGRWQTPRISNVPAYMLLQHITGGWETEGMDDRQLPCDLIFDYIRVWQRKDLASTADGPKPNPGGPLPPTKEQAHP
jgi:beta-glucanase (GH16 family)